jgi:hypothetical protein
VRVSDLGHSIFVVGGRGVSEGIRSRSFYICCGRKEGE